MNLTLSPQKLLGIVAVSIAIILDVTLIGNALRGGSPNGLAIFFSELAGICGIFLAGVITKKKFFPSWYIGAFFGGIASGASFVTSSHIGLLLSALAICSANIVMIASFINHKDIPENILGALTWIGINPLGKSVQGIALLFEKIEHVWKRIGGKGRALTIGIPVAIITLGLLSISDPLLEEMRERLSAFLPEYFFLRVCVAMGISVLFLILFFASTKEEPEKELPYQGERQQSSITWPLVLTLVNIPLGIFTLSQLGTYLFRNSGIIEITNTYAEYATRGTIEACVATVLVGSVICIAWMQEKDEKKLVLPTSLAIGALTLITLIAETKTLHYISLFGLTPTRIVGSLGVCALIASILISGFLLLTRKGVRQAFSATALIIIAFLTVIPFSQLDAWSMKYNIAHATTESPFDSTLAGKLSKEAVPILLQAQEDNIPMDGMMVNCKEDRKAYTAFLKTIDTAISHTEDSWINVTIPDLNLRAFMSTHTKPAVCTSSR